MYYLIYDVFPSSKSSLHEEFSGAIIGCWINTKNLSFAKEKASSGIREASWEISELIEIQIFKEEDIIENEFASQAVFDGEVFNAHRSSSYCFDHSQNFQHIPLTNKYLQNFIGNLNDASIFWSLLKDDQWAYFSSPEGDETFPIWLTEKDAIIWIEKTFPGFEPYKITKKELQEDFLPIVKSNDMWVGLGERSKVIVCHPARIESFFLIRTAPGSRV